MAHGAMSSGPHDSLWLGKLGIRGAVAMTLPHFQIPPCGTRPELHSLPDPCWSQAMPLCSSAGLHPLFPCPAPCKAGPCPSPLHARLIHVPFLLAGLGWGHAMPTRPCLWGDHKPQALLSCHVASWGPAVPTLGSRLGLLARSNLWTDSTAHQGKSLGTTGLMHR